MTTAPHIPPACPVCGDGEHISMLCKAEGFDVLRCATCTAEHARPVPSARELKAFYDRPAWFEGGEKGGYEDYDAQSAQSLGLVQSVLERFGNDQNLSLLDVGCGYGTHLQAAVTRGWKCFGVEISNHARQVAMDRLGTGAYIVADVAELIPHKFDLILMLDVLEHLPSPYTLLYQLYSIGAITPETTVVIATPNAGSAEAQQNPQAWEYRHPPSHLVYYTAEALTYLLRRLHFSAIEVLGTGADDPKNLAAAPGLLATASGSDFMQFMHERYVPGTWSKLAAYEHMPRYALAAELAAGKRVLDFGCGTGYGAAMLATAAKAVTGLDIDAAALTWAREVHRDAKLTFVQSADLGANLPDKSFDLITCFEMIEHVDHATQKAVVASFARLLRDDGVMIISTPNPEVTKHYDANPYHIREMTEPEFRELLNPYFSHIQILQQRVQASVTIDDRSKGANSLAARPLNMAASPGNPLAFIAVCAKAKRPVVRNWAFFDTETDFISDFLTRQRMLSAAFLGAYSNAEQAHSYKEQVVRLSSDLNEALESRETGLHERNLAQLERTEALHERNLAQLERTEALHERNLAQLERTEALHERNLAQLERTEALHERNLAQLERTEALNQRDNALAGRDAALRDAEHVKLAYHYLDQRRNLELSSPRFLFNQLLISSQARLRKFLRLETTADFRAQDQFTTQSLSKLMELPEAIACTQRPLVCSLIIPTKNGGELFKTVIASLRRQSIWTQTEFIIIDSGSTDDTIAVATQAGAKVVTIEPTTFNHGSTRDRAIEIATCDRIVLSVQDAVPLHNMTLQYLIALLDDETVAGGYARQVPQPTADLITKRNLNAWLTGRDIREVTTLADVISYLALTPFEKYKLCNFDNVCSTLRKSVWERERFGTVAFGEDIDWAERVLKLGHKIIYEPNAAVVHSHDRPLSYEYKRTYVCHRKLYQQFNLHLVPSLRRALLAWLLLTLSDMKFVILAKERLVQKLRLLFKLPALNALQVAGQYFGAKDESKGRESKVRGI